jgi:hypothetical protein
MATRKRVVEVPTRRRSVLEVRAIRVRVLHDEDPDPSYFDSGDSESKDQDEERRKEYENGDFSFVGVRAEAEVVVENVIQTITSGGLWGIESDSGEGYIEDVALEEYDNLREILKAIGVSTSQVPVGDKTMIGPLIKWEA